MDKTSAENLVSQAFNYPFNQSKYSELISNIFKVSVKSELNAIPISEKFMDIVSNIKIYSHYSDTKSKKIDALEIELHDSISFNKSRYIQRNVATDYLKKNNCDAVLVSFYNRKNLDWRLSLIIREIKSHIDEKGNIKIQIDTSPVKRLSYLVGQNEPNYTAKFQMMRLLINETNSLQDIRDAFNLEKISDQFFNDYKNLCFKIRDEINHFIKVDELIKREFFEKKIDSFDYAKKIMGQIIFIYFLQKKGWLGIPENFSFSDNKGSKNFLYDLFKKNDSYKNFFNDIYEPLVYEGFYDYHENYFYKKLNCKLPQLNISLFEPINNHNWKNTNLIISNKTVEEILNTLNYFNFTVDEEQTIDQDIAVDPEMLGKILENLMEKDERRLRGVFFTPKNIVADMCKNALSNHLFRKFDLKDKLQKEFVNFLSFLRENPDELSISDELNNFLNQNYEKIYKSIIELKVLDPSVGSGAFLVEILNICSTLITYISTKFNYNSSKSNYLIKKELIENCLYGVDINATSVEIAKLRLWLSLIVNEKIYNEKKSLPKLEFSLQFGNSLSDVKNLFDLNELSKIEDLIKQFNQENNNNKIEIIKKKIKKILSKYQDEDLFNFEVNFFSVFNKNHGFDIIIGNPPYEVLDKKNNEKEINRIKKILLYKNAFEGKLNYFKLFILKSIDLLKQNGVMVFIFQNSFLGDKTCSKIREFCFKNNQVLSISSFPERDDLNKRVFKSAKMSVCILELSKNLKNDYEFSLKIYEDKDKKKGFEIILNQTFIKKDIFKRIPCITEKELKIYYKILNKKNVFPLYKFAKCFEGEINLTFHKKYLSKKYEKNKFSHKCLKGANIQRFLTVEIPSQGEIEFLNKKKFYDDFDTGKSRANENLRIAIQGITGIDEKFRIKSSLVSKNIFLGNSANFLLRTSNDFTDFEIVTYLNSKLINWIFKIFSTNSNVNTYEINILPIVHINNKNKDLIKNIFNKLSKISANNSKELYKNNEYNQLVQLLDNVIYDTFELDNDEISIIEKKFS